MRIDPSLKIVNKLGGQTILADSNINKYVKAVVCEINNKSYVIYNENFKTKRKYPNFTKSKIENGLNKYQIVFSGVEIEHVTNGKYLNENNEICFF